MQLLSAAPQMCYDGTYAGLLTAVFECYRLGWVNKSQVGISPLPRLIATADYQPSLFGEPITVETQENFAERVLAGVRKKAAQRGLYLLHNCWLSEDVERSQIILRYIQRIMANEQQPEQDARDPHMLRLCRLKQQMGREVHRMHAFVRFQSTPDDLYVALIEPDFDVLPLLEDHFAKRYPAQEWIIYDVRRRYGLYWDSQTRQASMVTIEGRLAQEKRLKEEVLSATEGDYQELWKTYFDAVDIPERRNLKLHIQHVPKRYWKYLVEKWG